MGLAMETRSGNVTNPRSGKSRFVIGIELASITAAFVFVGLFVFGLI